MISSRRPRRFVGLHGHTGASAFDGLGPPSEHFKWCKENGLDGHALTEHGHMNSFAVAYLESEKWKKEGTSFKYIPGVEGYVHPDLNEWKRIKYEHEQNVLNKKEEEKQRKKMLESGVLKQISLVRDVNDEPIDVETANALTIENEDETKTGKAFSPLNRRHHLVVLPKTSSALKKIFKLVSRGYIEGFYRFPRFDIKMLKEASNGENDILISSACLGGPLSHVVFEHLRYINFNDLDPALLNDKALLTSIITSLENTYEQYTDAVGDGNFLIEMQMHNMPAQHVINRALLEFAKKNSLTKQLVVTADSHYARPELWYEREMYKKLGYLNNSDYNPDLLPKSKDELKAELYPKNVDQIWAEYQKYKQKYDFYDDVADELVCDAIERTHDIAHNVIGDITFDKTLKFPSRIVPTDTTPFNHLVKLCLEGIKNRGLDKKPEYVERMKYELSVIKQMKFALYFITLARVLNLARSVCLIGVARGSGGGSLVAYCLGITDLDPIKYDCRFDRFLNLHRSGAPDIDIDVGDRDAVLTKLREEFGMNNVIPISNINTFKVKTLVKDISKFYGIPFEEVNEATKTVEQDVRKATQKHGDDKNLFQLTFDDALIYSQSFRSYIEKHPEISKTINILFKEQRSLGRHAGGVIILDDAMAEMPVITSGGEPQSPWTEGVNGKYLEPTGIIKYDLLGLETMRLIQRTIELIIQRKDQLLEFTFEDGSIVRMFKSQHVETVHGTKKASNVVVDDVIDNKKIIDIKTDVTPVFADVRNWYNLYLHPDVNDYNDPSVYEYVYHKGNFAGVFQCLDENSLISLNNNKVKTIKDVIVGDIVVCFDEKSETFTHQTVVNHYDNGIAECLELTFENGITLVCTNDHLIKTSNRGWVKAIDLSEDDDIVTFK